MNNNLYFSKTDNVYLFNDLFKKCDICEHIINEVIFINCFWNNKKSSIFYTCFNCKSKLNDISTVKEQIIAVITLNIDENCTPVFIKRPLLANATNMTTFDVANVTLDKEQVIDNTVYANREDLEGATIGEPDIIKKLDAKDKKVLSIDEGLDLLDSIAKAKPLIEQDEQDKYLLR